MEKNKKNSRRSFTLGALILAIGLCLMTAYFVTNVKTQLWKQSINTILEATRQGRRTLAVQLNENYEDLGRIADRLAEMQTDDQEKLNRLFQDFNELENDIHLVLSEDLILPLDQPCDQQAITLLDRRNKDQDVIDPHISSVTGMDVFDLVLRVHFADGEEGYLIKEFEVSGIADTFTLSFYEDAGFSYVVDTQGNVLIRAAHPNSNKTVQNLLDMLSPQANDPQALSQFAQALKGADTGWAIFTYEGERTVFCFTPVGLQSDWVLISIIPEAAVNAQTNALLRQALTLILSAVLGISLLVLLYLRHRTKTQQRLTHQTNYISHLYNALPEAVALISVDPPYHLLQLNREGRRLLRYAMENSEDTLNQNLQTAMSAQDYARFVRQIEAAVHSGQKVNIVELMKKADGERFWTSGIIEQTLDENGKPVLIYAFHDITKEKQAEEAEKQRTQQERLTLVSALSNAYPVIISLNLTRDEVYFVHVSPGLMLDLGKQETYSELYDDLKSTVDPEFADDYEAFQLEALRKTFAGESGEIQLEMKMLLTDDQYHWTTTQIIHVDNPYSEDQLAILISRRIDEQRLKAERQQEILKTALENAQAASVAKSQFLSNMSHDIRTPMNAIVGMTAIAETRLNEPDRVKECLHKISLSSKHLLSLINDILDMSKIESGKLTITQEPFNFAELIIEVVELIRPQAEEKGLTFVFQLGVLEKEGVQGDPLRIRQICLNILSNAVKYTPAGGRVTIEMSQRPSSYKGYQNFVFQCSDTGIGMDPEFMKHLFQPFERSDNPMTRTVNGTGLGMAITKNLVDLMNGEIQVQSHVGQGSVFTVILPLSLQSQPDEQIPANWQGASVLIADDDLQIGEEAGALLTKLGMRADYCSSGEAAIAAGMQAQTSEHPYKLILIDWKMPEMNGLETVRELRQKLKDQPEIVILSAYDWSDIEEQARQCGVSGFLTKPFYRFKICRLLNELEEEHRKPISVKPTLSDFSDCRLLLAEDNEINREIVREMIASLITVEMDEVDDGQAAVEKIASSPEGYYDLVLMDIQMPRLNGYEATRQIRQLKRADVKTLPIIAMTANAFDEDVRLALQAGMNAHFAKPIDIQRLAEILLQFLTKSHRQGND
ncbi:response regulator [Holdemania massiliensis]|uniref:response regulator n=1 Tax=Holdemania massiliensis TaxID=1468449 RepID=UPI00267565E5|nr:response regulator [Holdemania massiliensis]